MFDYNLYIFLINTKVVHLIAQQTIRAPAATVRKLFHWNTVTKNKKVVASTAAAAAASTTTEAQANGYKKKYQIQIVVLFSSLIISLSLAQQ